MGQTRQEDTRTELSRPGEPGLTTRIVEKGIQHHVFFKFVRMTSEGYWSVALRDHKFLPWFEERYDLRLCVLGPKFFTIFPFFSAAIPFLYSSSLNG